MEKLQSVVLRVDISNAVVEFPTYQVILHDIRNTLTEQLVTEGFLTKTFHAFCTLCSVGKIDVMPHPQNFEDMSKSLIL